MFRRLMQFDFIMTGAVILLVSVGLAVLYSIFSSDGSGTANLTRQLVYFGIGAAAFITFSLVNYRLWLSYCNWLYFAGLFLLLLVLVLGVTVRGTSGWLSIGSVHFQVIEIEKIALIAFFAGFFSRKKGQLSEFLRTLMSVLLAVAPAILVILQPDLGSAMLLVIIWAGMLLTSGISWKNFVALIIVGAVLFASSWFLLKGYQRERIESFINPGLDPQGSGYNVIQSIVAVGSGGILGKGLGHGSQSHLNFLPEKHTDFIFAATAEELGFLGASGIIGLYLVIFWRIYRAAARSKDNFAYLVSMGALSLILGQTFINIGMNLGLIPVTGVPLPLLSYGGSSLVSTLALLGIINNISMHRYNHPTV